MRKHYFQWQNFLVGSEESRVICDLELSKNVPQIDTFCPFALRKALRQGGPFMHFLQQPEVL